MGLLREEGLRGALAWSRLPWSLCLVVLGALSMALRRAWETCDEAVARSWSALLFDEEEVEAGGAGVGRLLRRGAFGVCSAAHGPLVAVWERCLAASEAKDITLLSVLLALLGLGLQLFAVATALLEACVLRREGLLGLLGLVALEHKEAVYAWCDDQGLTALLGRLWPLGPLGEWVVGWVSGGGGDGYLLLDEVTEGELPELEDTAPPSQAQAARGAAAAAGNGHHHRRRRLSAQGQGQRGGGGANAAAPLSPGVVTRSSSRKQQLQQGLLLGNGHANGSAAIEAEEREEEEGGEEGQNGYHHHRGRGANGTQRLLLQRPLAASTSMRARPPPEGWLVYDAAAGVIPYEVAARWAAAGAASGPNGSTNGFNHHHHHHHPPPLQQQQQRRGASNGGVASTRALPPIRSALLPPVQSTGEGGGRGRRESR